MLVDIKDFREITKSGRILVAKHLLIVVLVFWIITKSNYYKMFLNESFNFIFSGPSNSDSALSTLAANNVGLLNSSHLKDGYNRCLKLNGLIEKAR